MDTDDNALYDCLVIEKEIEVRDAGNFELYGSLGAPSGKWIDSDWNYTYLDVGLHNVTFKFYGPSIYNSKESGKFNVYMDLYAADNWRWLDSTTDKTKAYDYTDFERPHVEFTENFSDYGIDTDDDTLYNHLMIESEINVTKAGEYELSGDLRYYDEEEGYWKGIDSDWNRTYLDAGIHNITLQFDGIRIYNAGYNGSFRTWLRLYETEEGHRIDEMEYFTQSYNYTDFQKPPAEFASGFNDYGLDTNDNALYDYLMIEKEIEVREAGNYELYGSLRAPSGKWLDSDSNFTYLDVGLHNVTLKFYGPSIYLSGESGKFNVYMNLYDRDNGRWLDSTTNKSKAYDYTDFERPPAEFTGDFDDYGLDTDGDGLYNYLVIESEINVTGAGEYELGGDLRYYNEENGYWELIDGDGNRTYLDAGIHNITLQFYGIMIYSTEYNGSFRTWLNLYETEEWKRIDEMEYLTRDYNYTDFQKPPAEFNEVYSDIGTDTDGDGLYDYLTVDVGVNVTTAGRYRVRGYLYDNTGYSIDYESNTTYLNAGSQTVQLNFEGIKIRQNEVNGPYNLRSLYLYDSSIGVQLDYIYDAYTTSYYDYTDFQIPPVEFNDVYADNGTDTDGDGLYNHLAIDVGVNVTKAGNYRVEGRLDDCLGGYIEWRSNYTYLNTGNQTVRLDFEGIKIRQNEVNGTFDLKYLYLYDSSTGDQLDYIYDAYTTSYYNYTEFQPPIPDAYEPDDDYSLANYIFVDGTEQTHNFHVPGDHDWLKFNATEGSSYIIETSELGTDSDTYLYLYDTEGTTEIYHDDDGGVGLASKIIWKCSVSGTYYVTVRHYSSSAFGPETRYNISVTVKEAPLKREPNGNIISSNTVFTGEHGLHFNITALPDVDYLIKQDHTELFTIPDPTNFYIPATCTEGVYDILNTTGGDIGDLTIKYPEIGVDVLLNGESIVDGNVVQGETITIRASTNFGGLINASDGSGWSKIKIKFTDPDGVKQADLIVAAETEIDTDYPTTDWKTGTWKVDVSTDKTSCNKLDVKSPEYEFTICSEFYVPFDTGLPANPYPSISGTHNGTLTPNADITVRTLYTYPCAGTGGHTESIELYENGEPIANGTWNGYVGDWHNITLTPSITLYKDHEYNYTIRTDSYPQIHHTPTLPTANGWINCTEFTDANGKKYDDWIPAIKLFY